MDDRIQSLTTWHVQFPAPELSDFANEMTRALSMGGTEGVGPPVLISPKEAHFSATTVLLTIVATSISKAAVVYGLRTLEKMVAERMNCGDENVLKIEIKGETGRPMPFACSLKAIGRDSLKRFFDGIINHIEKL